MKIYLSGKITGHPGYKKDFTMYEMMIRDHLPDVIIVNPVKLCADIPNDAPHEVFMEKCLKALEECDAIYMIPNWGTSKGARMELKRATRLGLQIIIG